MNSERLAKIISAVLHPFILLIPVLLAAIYASKLNLQSSLYFFAISVMLYFLIPFVSFWYLVKRGKISSFEHEKREERPAIYALITACWLAAAFVLYVLNAPKQMLFLILASAIVGVALTLITLRWKISIHAAFFTVFMLWAILVFGWIAAWLIIPLLLTVWARQKLKYHTMSQLLAGIFLSTIVTWLVNWVLK